MDKTLKEKRDEILKVAASHGMLSVPWARVGGGGR
jgi:hypothetical protein